jgi:outer membrane receptor protein involved in Fe transport
VEQTRRRGVEASLDYAVPNRLTIFGTYSFQQATFGTDLRIASQFHPLADGGEIVVEPGSRLPGVPSHTAKFGATTHFPVGLSIGLAVRAQSAQYYRGDEANLLDRLPGFAVVNVQARQRVIARLTAVAQLQNVFDADYASFGVLGDAGLLGETFEDEPRFNSPGAPRAAWIGLEVRF